VKETPYEHFDVVRLSRGNDQSGSIAVPPPAADMTAPITQPAGTAGPHRLLSTLCSDWFAIVLAVLLGLAVANLFLNYPDRVDIEITNPTVYAPAVEISGDERDGWQLTARLGPGATRTIQDVLDQGDVWVFRFAGQGRAGGELEVTRQDLERAAWHLDIPAEVGDRLAAQGVAPTPTATPGSAS
jgi:hypothetical protein